MSEPEFPNIAAGLRVWWFHGDGSVHATCTEHPEWGDRMCGSPDWVMARYAAHLVAHHAIKPGDPLVTAREEAEKRPMTDEYTPTTHDYLFEEQEVNERIAEALEALVEQMRIANLIALQTSIPASDYILRDNVQTLEQWPDIAAALGLEADDE